MATRTAIYAGTFDPLTFGHLDLVERALGCFDHLILAFGVNRNKKTLFTLEERMDLARSCMPDDWSITLTSFEGLLVDFAHKEDVNILIRGLRAFSDFEFELNMALTNRKLAPDIETLFLMPKEEHSYISSSRVKEVSGHGGDVSSFVPEPVRLALKSKHSN